MGWQGWGGGLGARQSLRVKGRDAWPDDVGLSFQVYPVPTWLIPDMHLSLNHLSLPEIKDSFQ